MLITKKALIVAGLLMPVGLYLVYNTETKNSFQAKKELTVTKPKVAEYKTIFKKEEVESKIESIQNTTDLESINKDADSIIAKADSFIKTHNLKVPTKVEAEKDIQKQEKFDAKLQDLQQELEELSNES